MATFNKLPSGYWRAQVRRKSQYASRTYRLKAEAETWAIDAERALTTGMSPNAISIDRKTSFATLIELHISDLKEVGRPRLRSKAMCLEKLKRDLGREKLSLCSLTSACSRPSLQIGLNRAEHRIIDLRCALQGERGS
jgi:hypothetical protein